MLEMLKHRRCCASIPNVANEMNDKSDDEQGSWSTWRSGKPIVPVRSTTEGRVLLRQAGVETMRVRTMPSIWADKLIDLLDDPRTAARQMGRVSGRKRVLGRNCQWRPRSARKLLAAYRALKRTGRRFKAPFETFRYHFPNRSGRGLGERSRPRGVIEPQSLPAGLFVR